MSNKVIGTFREKRGDDHYRVVTSEDGDVVGIEQYDSLGHRWVYLNLFTETVPKLVALLRKVTGGETEYEYAILRTILSGDLGEPMIVGEFWGTPEETNEGLLKLSTDRVNYKLVKRRKAGRIEDAT